VVVALPGDLEPAKAHGEAITTLRKRGDHVVDGRLARWIEVHGGPAGEHGVTVGIVPGGGARERLVAGTEGCGYAAADIAAIVGELTRRSGLRILASAEAPRGLDGPVGRRGDRGGEATGELALMAAQPVDLAVHGPSGAVGAASTAATGGRDGAKVRLTPGTADATTRLPDAHLASAGVLVIRGASWTWKPLVDSSK